MEDDRISLVDSRVTTLALGVIVLKAAELAQKGMEREEIVRQIEEYKKEVRILIMVDTLEYLKRGGRLSGAQAMIGGIMNIKPILTVEDGKVVVSEKARGVKKALKRIVEVMAEKGKDIPKQVIGIANANCPDTANTLKKLIIEEFGNVEFIDTMVGSVIATHVGPGAFGVVFIEKTN